MHIVEKRNLIALVFLAILASFLRFYRIAELTEFLGDQGRTGLVIYEAWRTGIIPLAGPTVLSGQHLGPFFYYLMAPSFIFSNFNPLAPAIFTAILGILTVLLMYYIGNKLFGFSIGFLIAVLYAVSPSIVTQDRILWEPNIIPFFLLLFIIALYNIYEEKKPTYLLLLAFSLCALIQLHYPNVFLIFLAFLFWIYAVYRLRSGRRQFFFWSFSGIFVFFLLLFPLLLYEWQHNFSDLKELALIFLLRSGGDTASLPIHLALSDFSFRLFKNVMSFPHVWWFTATQIAIVFSPLLAHLPGGIARHILNYRFWHIFFSFWLTAGLFGMSLYKGVVFDHYLMFLLPIPYFLLGYFLKTVNTFIPKQISRVILVVLIVMNLSRTDIFFPGNNDITRTQKISNLIIEQSNNESFSFTLISSRSFSDLHYRYFFKLKGVKPLNITGKNYKLLFLVCEKSPCPTREEIEKMSTIQVLCYDPHCEGEYPKIDLRNFILTDTKDILDSRIFIFKKLLVK